MSDSFERGINVLKQPLSILPEHISDLVLEHIRQSIHYEPVIGIMGKTGAGKSSLCNALFEHPLSPVSHAEGCTRKPLHFTLNAGGRSLTLVCFVTSVLNTPCMLIKAPDSNAMINPMYYFPAFPFILPLS